MQIDKGTSAVVTVRLQWANLIGVRALLRQKYNPHREIPVEIQGSDDSHIIYAKILDAESPFGLWIEIEWSIAQDGKAPALEKVSFLIPWAEVLTIVIGKDVQEESKRMKIGF